MKIAQDILTVLENAEATPQGIKLLGQLDRTTYDRVNKVLTAAGWKWNRSARAHIHPNADPADALESMIETGQVIKLSDFGFFETTGFALDRIIVLADILPGMTVLEPSAGTGNIVRRCKEKGGIVNAVEILDGNISALARIGGVSVTHQDFLTLVPEEWFLFDRVVMNPPFAKQADIQHVAHAIRFLKPGGRLVAIMAAGVRFRTNGRTRTFHEAIAGMSPIWEDLPEGSFKAVGTSVDTCILTLVKP